MSDHVWILQRGMFTGNELRADFLAPISPPERLHTEEEAAREGAMNKAIYEGKLISEEHIPRSLISTFPDSKVKMDREFFDTGFMMAVSGRMHDIMKDFDYGGGGFHAALPYRKGKLDTPLGGPFYLLNFAGKKSALLPEISSQLYHNKNLDTYRALDVKDNDIAVSRAALFF